MVCLLGCLQAFAAPPSGGKGKGPPNGKPDERLIAFDQFTTGTDGWSAPARQALCSANDAQLGVFGVYGSGAVSPVSRTYAIAGEHSYLRIQATVSFLDNWQGETVTLSADGTQVWVDSWHHCPKVFSDLCAGISVCGDETLADRLGQTIDVLIPHTGDTLTLTFETGLGSASGNASLLVDDVRISAR